jgi:hypothetical protein
MRAENREIIASLTFCVAELLGLFYAGLSLGLGGWRRSIQLLR